MDYSNNLILRNINYLLEEIGMGIGDFEAKMGVSTGYTTRTFKKESINLNMDFVVNVCNYFKISIDDLIFRDLSASFPNEKKTYSFLSKLTDDTWDSKLNWKYETPQELNERVIIYSGSPICSHPLFTHLTDERAGVTTDDAVFVSHTFDENTRINGDCYHLDMSDGATLYLMNIRDNYDVHYDAEGYETDPETALEVWMVLKDRSRHFICDNKARKGIGDKLEELYAVIKRAANCPKTSEEVESVIDAFIGKDDEVKLPFEL